MTKDVLDYSGKVFVKVKVKSKGGIETIQNGQAYSSNVKQNFNNVYQRAVLNALGNHIYSVHKESLYNYQDYLNLVNGLITDYDVLSYRIKYYGDGFSVKRVRIDKKYYTQVKEKGKIKATFKMNKKKVDDLDVSVSDYSINTDKYSDDESRFFYK